MTPCVGCGYCCIKVPCGVATRLHGVGVTRCPELEWSDSGKRYICKLVVGSGRIPERYREELSTGAGCCSSLNSWRKDIRPRLGENAPVIRNPLPLEVQVLIRCIASQFMSSDAMWLSCHTLWQRLVAEHGWKEEEAKDYARNVLAVFRSNRDTFTEGFIG